MHFVQNEYNKIKWLEKCTFKTNFLGDGIFPSESQKPFYNVLKGERSIDLTRTT